MIYQFDSRIRYSEVDMERKLTFPGIVNYFQDCSSFHSESLGVGIDFLKDRQCAWVLSAWQIVAGRRPFFGEKVTVQTWPYLFKGFLGERNFCMLDENGRRIVWANSVWTYLDLKTGHPARISKEEIEAYVPSEKLDMQYAPRKIPVPKESIVCGNFPVEKKHLDTNQHVNNGQYIQMAMACIPDGFEIGQMRAEYKKAAVLGDRIVLQVHQEKERVTVTLCSEEAVPYAVVEFTRRECCMGGI